MNSFSTILLCLFLISSCNSNRQKPAFVAKKTNEKCPGFLHLNSFQSIQSDSTALVNNVQLKHLCTELFWGNVELLVDSTTIYSDSLLWTPHDSTVYIPGRVILKNHKRQIIGEHLVYEVGKKKYTVSRVTSQLNHIDTVILQ